MLEIAENQLNSISDEWASQSEHWITETAKLSQRHNKRERNKQPLILNGHGASLRIENATLLIRDGFTHHPHTPNQYRFFRGDLDLPNRIILLDGSGTLTFDALSWLTEQGVALARIKGDGTVSIVASGNGYCADATLTDWQRNTHNDETARLKFSTDIISAKLTNALAVLETEFAASVKQQKAIAAHRSALDRLQQRPAECIYDLLKTEGECAAFYFGVWRDLEISWNATARHPIPEAWRRYSSRSSLTSEKKPKNGRASHPVNAMLNYGYKVREVQLQIQAIAQGYDPAIGIMHKGLKGNAAFIFDMIEPERAKVDRAIIALIKAQAFSGADFLLRKDGVCRLSPQLGKLIARIVSDLPLGFAPRN